MNRHPGKMFNARLWQTPDGGADVNQQPCVAQDLKLLPDFVADVPIIRMQLFQLAGEGIGVGGGESPSPFGWESVTGRSGEGKSSYDVQHVECPAPKAFGVLISRMGLSRA